MRPAYIGCALTCDLVRREGTIQSLVDYENSLSNNTWMGWAVNTLVNSPLKWSFKKVTEVMNSSSSVEIDENNEYIHLASLKVGI